VNQAQGFIHVDDEGRPGRGLAFTFKGLAAAAMITTEAHAALLMKLAGGAGIAEEAGRDQRRLMHPVNRDEYLRHIASPHE
jgi:hypothetical protein